MFVFMFPGLRGISTFCVWFYELGASPCYRTSKVNIIPPSKKPQN